MPVLAREAVVALEALLADHVVAARRRRAPRALVHAMPTRPRAGGVTAGRRCYQASSISARISRSPGGVGRHLRAPAGPGSPSTASSMRVAVGAELARAAAGRRRAPRSGRASPACFVPSARASAVICLPARGRIASIVARQHRRVGLRVRDPQHAHERLADDVVEREQRRVERVGAEDRAERELRRVALGAVGVERLGDQRRAAQRRHRRDRVGERRVERVGAVGERVHRARAQPLLGQADHHRRVGEHDLPGGPARRRPRGPRAGGGCGSSRRPRASSAAPRPGRRGPRRSPSPTSITRPPPSATRSPSPTSSISRAATSLHRARAARGESTPRPRPARPAPRPSPARWSAARSRRSRARRGSPATSRDHPGAEVDRPLPVAPGELAAHSRARSGTRTHSLSITKRCSTS